MSNPGYDIREGAADYGTFYEVDSAANKRSFPVMVFTPQSGNNEDWPVVYHLHGSNSQPIEEAGLRAMYHPDSGMQEAADFFQVLIVCPLMGNFSYLDAPKDAGVRHATFVGEELVAWVDASLSSRPDRVHRYLAGFSMGGGGSVRLICTYPDTFSVALSRGGALDPAAGVVDLDWDDVNEGAYKLLGNYWGEDRVHYHQASCMNTVNHIRDRDDVGIVLEVGTDDFLYKCNRRVHERLHELGFQHIYAEYPEGHQWGRNQLFSLYTHLQYFRQTH